MSIGMYDSCYNPKTYAYSYSGNAGVNHAVTLVGWDDNFAKENFNSSCNVTSDGAWIVRNSWGEQWGVRDISIFLTKINAIIIS